MRTLTAVLILLITCPISFMGQSLSPLVKSFVKVDAPVVALIHVRVIDGTGAEPREDQMIVIRQGKIDSVGEGSEASAPKDAQVIDLKGYTVIPGLVGMHEHMFYPAGDAIFHEMAISFPRLYLAAGVTTARTAGSIEPYMDLALKREIDGGEAAGPKIHVTGPYLEGPGVVGAADDDAENSGGGCGHGEFLGGSRRG